MSDTTAVPPAAPGPPGGPGQDPETDAPLDTDPGRATARVIVRGVAPDTEDADADAEIPDALAVEAHDDASTGVLPAATRIAEGDTDAEITEKLRRQGVRIGAGGITPRVFWPALLVIVAVAVIAVVTPAGTSAVFNATQNWIVSNLGWYYMLAIAGFLAFALVLACSRLGRIKLGRDDEKPEFGVFSWFCMLFAAGMGIGLIFYGVGEPLTFASTAPKPGWTGSAQELAPLAMAQTYIHWGLHPWGIYAVIGLATAYSIHRRGRPVSIRWALEPLLGDRVKGWAGDVIDVLAIFGTVFGVATSLGLGVQQIAAGLAAIGVVGTVDNILLVVLITVITFCATFSVVSGLGTGIKWLSNINITLAGLLMVSVLVFGPTVFLLQNFTESLGVYLANFFGMTFDIGAYAGEDGAAWFSGWTIFYWGWWIAWAPFVGIFIARISRGRTIREFVAGTLIVPTLVGFVWFAVLGGAGLHRLVFGEGDFLQDEGLLSETGSLLTENALFAVLGDLPLGSLLSVVAIILVALFFITSSDSGSLVVDMLASGGHPNPPVWSRVLWAFLEGLLAIALLLAGGLHALQAGSLITALPFSVVLVLMCAATWKALRADDRAMRQTARAEAVAQMADHVTDRLTRNPGFEEFVHDRIDYRLAGRRPPLRRRASRKQR